MTGRKLPDSATASVAFLARGGPTYVASERAGLPITTGAARKGTARERGRTICPDSPRASRFVVAPAHRVHATRLGAMNSDYDGQRVAASLEGILHQGFPGCC